MENVTIVGTEAGVLVLATESGQRFALPIDEVLHREVRRATREAEPSATRLAASPRDIQMQIRAGLSTSEVAALLGVSESDVARFEGPVLAEREHIVDQALAVPVLIGNDVEPDAQPTFGDAVRAKLDDLHAVDERWASWKDDSGWMIKLQFTADDVEHDARWAFDPRRSALSPQNADATQLSRQGSLPNGLVPRLRAVDSERVSPYKDDSRFDSGAFGPVLVPELEAHSDNTEPATEHSSAAVQEAAARHAPEESHPNAETADLLEALRRRRGQRESAPQLDATDAEDSGPIALFDALEDEQVDSPPAPRIDAASAPHGRRKRRNAMPSWDEIVFGARTEE